MYVRNVYIQGLFNNAAQAWNHDFYWKCMKPSGGGEVTRTCTHTHTYRQAHTHTHTDSESEHKGTHTFPRANLRTFKYTNTRTHTDKHNYNFSCIVEGLAL